LQLLQLKLTSTKPAEIQTLQKKDGTCNVLVVVPHGHDDNDTNAEKLGAHLADALDSHAVKTTLETDDWL